MRVCVFFVVIWKKEEAIERGSGKKNTLNFVVVFGMSWNPLKFTDCNTLCSYCGLHRTIYRLLMLLLLLLVVVGDDDDDIWDFFFRTSLECSAGIACALCLQCVHEKERTQQKRKKNNAQTHTHRRKKNDERHKMKCRRIKSGMKCCCVFLVCSWLHTNNNDDLKKNICS